MTYRPDMPDYGIYAFWPEPGDNWYHPDDADLVNQCVPGKRVLKRTHYDGEYYHVQYGKHTFRVRPTMWQSVPATDLEIDQAVEILGRHGCNDPGIGFVREIFFSQLQGRLEFLVSRGALRSPRPYLREDLRPVEVKYQLRIGFYPHAPQTCDPRALSDCLDVGSMTD